MQNYIVAFDLSDDAINKAANLLYKQLDLKVFVDINQADEWAEAQSGCTLYLINHANGTQFGDYNDPAELLNENTNLYAVYKKANRVVLVSCSTANEADLILKSGFQVKTFAQNLKAFDKSKTVVAAVGPVFPKDSGLVVKVPSGVIGFASKDGWVQY